MTTTPARPANSGRVRVWAVHPDHDGLVVFWPDGDPWAHLAYLLESFPHRWPSNGWRLTMDDLRCQLCGETNRPQTKPLVELMQTHRGTVVVCGSCGKEGPRVSAALPPGSSSGLPI